jgi:hypothetical protein
MEAEYLGITERGELQRKIAAQLDGHSYVAGRHHDLNVVVGIIELVQGFDCGGDPGEGMQSYEDARMTGNLRGRQLIADFSTTRGEAESMPDKADAMRDAFARAAEIAIAQFGPLKPSPPQPQK